LEDEEFAKLAGEAVWLKDELNPFKGMVDMPTK